MTKSLLLHMAFCMCCPKTGLHLVRKVSHTAPHTRGLHTLFVKWCPQTDILSERKAQYAFKDSMVHKVLQFTLLIAFRCVLYRFSIRNILYLSERELADELLFDLFIIHLNKYLNIERILKRR